MFNVNMPGTLPIQITNLARKSVVLGNLVVTSEAGSMMNNSVFVGTLDPGGYFTLDPMFTPMLEGPAVIKFEVRYTDDFNQLRTYNSELVVDVMPEIEMPSGYPMLDENGEPVLDEWGNPIMIDPNFPNMPVEPVEEPGFFARIWNAIKGFFGFGTGDKYNEMPVEQFPSEGNFKR